MIYIQQTMIIRLYINVLLVLDSQMELLKIHMVDFLKVDMTDFMIDMIMPTFTRKWILIIQL